MQKEAFLMPDYYPDFSCKMGACRKSCCEGWPVSLSMDDYFRLVGLACRHEIRKELDCALHLLTPGTPDRYAEISHKYDGDCHLRLPDGRCIIQGELGDKVLPAICRLYPRAIRLEGENECSASASCERVVEMLVRRNTPLSFIPKEMECPVERPHDKSVFAEEIDGEGTLRMWFIEVLQEKGFSLPEKLYRLGYTMREADGVLKAGDTPNVKKLRENLAGVSHTLSEDDLENRLFAGLSALEELMGDFDRHGATLNEYGRELLGYFGKDDTTLRKYLCAKERFEKDYPTWQTAFENLLVNHMFYTRFPFASEGLSLQDEYFALCVIYASMRFLAVGSAVTHPGEEHMVDTLSAAFRLIEHTPFHRYSAMLLHRSGFDTPEDVFTLTNL